MCGSDTQSGLDAAGCHDVRLVAVSLTLAPMLVCALALLACGIPKDKYEGTVADLKKCQEERDQTKQRVAELEKQLGDVTVERDKASAHGSELEGTMSATQKELAELRKQHEEAQKRLAAFRALTARFQKMIDAGKIQVAFRNGNQGAVNENILKQTEETAYITTKNANSRIPISLIAISISLRVSCGDNPARRKSSGTNSKAITSNPRLVASSFQ